MREGGASVARGGVGCICETFGFVERVWMDMEVGKMTGRLEEFKDFVGEIAKLIAGDVEVGKVRSLAYVRG